MRIDCLTSNIIAGTKANIDCQNGYTSSVNHTKILKCQENGKWDQRIRYCQPICGKIPDQIQGFVVGGKVTSIKNIPWQAIIYKKIDGNYDHICGGSIISELLIVTAAHCLLDDNRNFVPESSLRVGVGKTSREYHYEMGSTKPQIRDIRKYQINMKFSKDSFFYDIATNVIGKVAGWGLNEGEYFGSELAYADFKSISKNDCQYEVGTISSFVRKDKFCVKKDEFGMTLCKGDSGGGFAVKVDGTFFLEGVVSAGLLPNNESCNTHNFYTTLSNIQGNARTFVIRWKPNMVCWGRPSKSISYRCAGSVISENFVLTAAHCVTNLVDDLKVYLVRLGDLRSSRKLNCKDDPIRCKYHQDFDIEY
uniref:Peptidase S1 domain-containing protein n=1 Tax=Megaselia scalaris TaxID=36166 RepID=T1H2P8_MEGSC